ncbi:hypothetical protein [Prosthecobacter sp.]|uniref:hypothetical protein n=1 Tax=Prosthecobacter sp. TaxID=1965333 RepID=UPI00378306DF
MNSERTDRLWKLLLGFSALGAGVGLVSFGLGVDEGAFLVFAMMAVATFPLFHFASRWPMKKKNE